MFRGVLSARKDDVMDEDRLDGMGKRVSGSLKEAIGKVTGDAKTEAEGSSEKMAGEVQDTVGGAKDAARDAVDD